MRRVLGVVGIVAGVAVLYVIGAFLGLYGKHEGPGIIRGPEVSPEVVALRAGAQREAADAIGAGEGRQILFGDLHVHTTYSTDAFLWSLPMMQGEGAHPVADACDYARYCSALDFWSINDHAEASTPRKWRETKETIRQCNAIAGDRENPDVAVFLGWEWSQVGRTPEEHYGHKNVIFRGLGDDEVPARTIGAAGIATDGLRSSVGRMSPIVPLLELPRSARYFNFIEFMNEVREVPFCPEGVASPELPPDCYESARTPADLFRKLSEWGLETIVIPHGNTWGFYSPPGTTWDKQLVGAMHDPSMQSIIEVMSGHGNSEEYRDWRAVKLDDEGNPACPEPTTAYLPSCWRAGELVEARCREAGGEEAACAEKAADARLRYAYMGVAGHLVVPDAEVVDWLDAGQCRDCFLPSFNYRPGGSTQYALSLSSFENPEEPRRFRFGIIASSDNHRARPGTGYKETDRLGTTEAAGPRDETWRRRVLRPKEGFDAFQYDFDDADAVQKAVQGMGFVALEAERQTSFFMTGGLAAVHASGRDRDSVWEALRRKEVYGTSGDRILLWFDLLNGKEGPAPMGSEVRLGEPPRFRVRAVGAFQQKEGCPAESVAALSPARLERLCKGECYNPSDQRKVITRIEVVRIRPQATPDEKVAERIEDPWKVFECEPDPAGCAVELEDPEFVEAERDTVYYVRAIEEPSPAVNARNLRCEYDAAGNCVKIDPCYGDYRTPKSDDCLAMSEERAWSSPIFVDWAGTARRGPADPGLVTARR